MTMSSRARADGATRPRRFLFVVSSLHGGGAEFVARTWMAWLVGRGHSVSVVLTSAGVDRARLPAGVRAKSLAGVPGQLAKAKAVRAVILDSAPDAAISLQTHPNLVLLTAARGVPRQRRPKVLISERNLVSLGLPGASVSHRVKIWTAKRLYRQADHVIAISHPVAGELVAAFGVRGGRITVVPNPAIAKVGGGVRSGRSDGGGVRAAVKTGTDTQNGAVLPVLADAAAILPVFADGTTRGADDFGADDFGAENASVDDVDADQAVFAASAAGAVAAARAAGRNAGAESGAGTGAGAEPGGSGPGGAGAAAGASAPGGAGAAAGASAPGGAGAGPGGADAASAPGAAGAAGAGVGAGSNRRAGSDRGIQIVLACRLVHQKRPLLAIAAAAELQRRGIPVEVVSFGGGPLLGDMVVAAGRAGVAFRHEGWVENWFEHFGENAVALLPSSREGFGNVLVEAAAAGYPSVAVSGALGVADAIVPGITGELALTAEPADIADAVLRASELRLGDIDAWLNRFSAESSGAALERVLEYTLRDGKEGTR